MTESGHHRRRSTRKGTTRQVTLRSPEGEVLAEGIITNISEEGAFVVLRAAPDLVTDGVTILEMKVSGSADDEGSETRRQRGRVVRFRKMGDLTGLGIEFVEDPQ